MITIKLQRDPSAIQLSGKNVVDKSPKEPQRPRSASIFESPMDGNEACKFNTIATQLCLQVGVSWLHPRHKYMDTPRNYCEFWKWNFFFVSRRRFKHFGYSDSDADDDVDEQTNEAATSFLPNPPFKFTIVPPLDHLTTSVNGKWKCLPHGDCDADANGDGDDDVDERGGRDAARSGLRVPLITFYYHTHIKSFFERGKEESEPSWVADRTFKILLRTIHSTHTPTDLSREYHASGCRFRAQARPKINCQLIAFDNRIRFARKR